MADTRRQAKDSNVITEEYFDKLYVELRHIDSVKPDTGLTLFGRRFKTPVMTAALSHLKGRGGEGDGMVQQAEGALAAGAVNWLGRSSNEQFAAVMATGAPTVRVIKPYADEAEVAVRMRQAEELGALAVGMDLDHSFNSRGEYDNVRGDPMRPRSFKEIEAYCKSTPLPFILKGILSAADAKKCVDAGVGGIVVSHHRGILPTAVPPLMALEKIVEAVDGRMPVFIDCGFTNGMDVFKALALGASAVSVGHPLMPAIAESGAGGAAAVIDEISAELAGVMARTGSPDLAHIDRSILWREDGTQYTPRA